MKKIIQILKNNPAYLALMKENGDIVVAIINGDEATIKKGKKSNNTILLQPFNTDYEPLIFSYDEMKTIPVTIVGVVKQLKREF